MLVVVVVVDNCLFRKAEGEWCRSGGVEDCPAKKSVATVDSGWWCCCGPAEKRPTLDVFLHLYPIAFTWSLRYSSRAAIRQHRAKFEH